MLLHQDLISTNTLGGIMIVVVIMSPIIDGTEGDKSQGTLSKFHNSSYHTFGAL